MHWNRSTLLPSNAPADPDTRATPSRWPRPSWFAILLVIVVVGFLIQGYRHGAKIEPITLVTGAGRFIEFARQAFPPDISRLASIWSSLLVTFEMALVGTIAGIMLALPLGLMAARNTSPHTVFYGLARGIITMCRTIPDLVWALLFVITVGLGPKAGVLAIAVDVAGFAGRFFAEAIEETDPTVSEGLRSTGAGPVSVVVGGILPACLPSFVATSMFSLESSTRSAVVLGIVGAGGIGVDLNVAMTLLRYDEAVTIILSIFVVVLVVERTCAAVRKRLM